MPPLKMPPPVVAVLSEMVLLVTVPVPPLLMPPPVPAELPEMTLLVTVSVLPPALLMPPPKPVLPALPFSMVRPEMAATLPIQNTDPTAPSSFPLTARMEAPGPLMVRFFAMMSAIPGEFK